MSWRARRQLIALLIVLIPIAVIGFFGVKKFLPALSCTDNKKNQGEIDTDCGGPCGPCELKHPRDLITYWAKAVLVRPDVYDVAAEIQNPNEVLSSGNVAYEFILFDNLGPVAIKQGRTFILAQERMHIVEANLSTTRAPERIQLKILNVDWQFRQDAKQNIVVERKEYRVDDDGTGKKSVLEAGVANRSSLDFKEAEVRFTVLDKDGNLLGANRVVMENFLNGSHRTVKSIWPIVLQGVVASTEVEPRVNLFDPEIILKP